MFITKNSKSPFYQLIYKVNGKRTSISTGKITEREAQKSWKILILINLNSQILRKSLYIFQHSDFLLSRKNVWNI